MTGEDADRNGRESAVDGGSVAPEQPVGVSDTAVERVVGGWTPREQVELVGIGLTAVLAAVMLAFIGIDWLRDAPGVLGVFGTLAFDRYLAVGVVLDGLLGTNVFRHPFMWRAIATGVLVAIVGPLVGTYLVHRQMALIGETLAHTAFAGVAVGFLFIAVTGWTGSLLFVALVVSVLGALGLQWLAEHTDAYGDVPVAIVLTGSFAVGTLLISWGRDFVAISIDIEDFLFGSLAIVTAEGAQLVAAMSVGVVALVAYNYKQFLFITFDEQAARVARLNVRWYNALLIVMTAVVVVGAMQILGVILVAGLLVIPVAAASQIAHSFRETLFLSILFGQVSVLGGLAFAISASLPPGGSIIVVAIGIYLLAVAASDRSIGGISVH
ncbi:zinc transport system permease protein [Halalkaliarchaeum desulfuricum]|uniref:Zinc transport system permease protein n=1 Tax=Halalkaliarchaeum desulfuricum TaxID=2055893 RepID=A0A343TGR0_9EURY|nr:metal ABC transporter permease [Halalkaliarchaeum desulfuricum]AUX08282.1 zinc transport system permease protein [Halalkaliarchaeum desulfuricum]